MTPPTFSRWLRAVRMLRHFGTPCMLLVALTLPRWLHAQEVPPEELPRFLTLQDYRDQVAAILPQFGPELLAVQDGTDWLSQIGVQDVAAAVNDLPAPEIIESSGLLVEAHDAADTKFIKIDGAIGRVRWGNKGRRFNYDASPHQAVSAIQARQTMVSVCNVLGIPPAERDSVDLRTVLEEPVTPAGRESPYDRERLLTMMRKVNGYPVFGSLARLSVSNLGQPARLLVVWPRFTMSASLTLRPRPAVVNAIADHVSESVFGAAVEMGIHLAYARVGASYVPAAIVAFSDPQSGQVLVVPLVSLPPDADLDGVPDAGDNCPDQWNLGQHDSDGDGVGDACDNCPGTPNAGQLDVNGNGIGDACDSPEGACTLLDGTCEVLTSELCSLSGGTFLGNGTECDAVGVETLPQTDGASLDLRVHPNPTRAAAVILFAIAEPHLGPLTVDIYDSAGRLVSNLHRGVTQEKGKRRFVWDGRDDQGENVAAGVYFVRVRTRGPEEIRKITLLR